MSELSSPTGRGPPKGPSSTIMQAATGRKGLVAPSADFDFNLGVTKTKVMKALEEQMPQQFRKFYNSPLFDRLLQTCLLYLTTMFQLEWVVASMDKSRKQHLEGYNPYVIVQRIRELEVEVGTLRMEMSPLYSQIILQYSSYNKPQQDRKFFEALYTSLAAIMDDAFDRLKKQAEIERELGLLFRSKHFNIAHRKHLPPRSVDTLSVKELYALKNETQNRALNARMLSSLFEKPAQLGVTVASVTNSPLVSQYIMSPIVARSMMKDPEQRAAMLKPKTPGSGQPADHSQMRRQIGNVFRSAAMLQGVNPDKLSVDIRDLKMKMENATDIGIMPAERARKSDFKKGAPVAPEALGLPVDDAYNFLTLMKRYIMYGPSLGLQGGAAPGTAAGGGTGGMTVPPTPSSASTGGGLNLLAATQRLMTAGQ